MNRSIAATGAALGLIAVGLTSFAAPKLLAELFGVPIDGASGRVFLRGVGSRDVALGFLLLTSIAFRDEREIRASLFATAFAGASDLIVVTTERGLIPNLLIHAGGLAALLALGFGSFGLEE